MVRYTKLPTIIRYKIESVKGKPSEEEYLALTLMVEHGRGYLRY